MRKSFAWIVLGLTLVDANAGAAKNRKYGTQVVDIDPQSKGVLQGTGIESRDIDAMADGVVRDLMARPDFVSKPRPPRIVLDSERFTNNSSQRIDKDMITDALRASLNRAASGRLRFISRESIEDVERERSLKRSGTVDVGTGGMTRATSGADYRMIGRMTSLEQRGGQDGMTQRRTQIVFELVDLETGDIPWTSQPFVVVRASAEDSIYR